MNSQGEEGTPNVDDFLSLHAEPELGLRRHAVRQTSATLVAQVAQAALGLIGTFILARLLVPSDFGLIAMVAILVGFVSLFRDIGLTQAVIQQDQLNTRQVNGLFWASVAATVVFAGVTAISGPVLAAFYSEPSLVGITLGFAVVVLLGGLGTMPQAILSRQMAFHRIVIGEVIGAIIGVVTATAVAVLGGGYWALVALPAARTAFTTAYLWTICPWRPRRPRRHADVSSMLRFGGNVTGFNAINYFARNADNLLIGWRWGTSQLGQYAAAYRILMLPITQLNVPVSRVTVPVLARLAHDPARYRRATVKVVRSLLLVTAPGMALIAVESDWVVAILLGPGWGEAASILRWLAIAAIVQPLANATGWLFLTQDRAAEMLRLGLMSSALAVGSFVIGLPFGALGVAIAYSVVDVCIRTPLAVFWAGRKGPVSALHLASALLIPLVLAAWVAIVAVVVRMTFEDIAALAGLALTLAIALAGSAILLVLLPEGRTSLTDLRGLSRDLLSSRSGE